ncbi:MAG: heavy metal translocating P-type ATPase, partial [Spirochaetaceae bacterium]|nr:heavy metal translocating P-type ATPase [Spirochaetaceae bacterium]
MSDSSKEINYKLTGIDCPSCASGIEQALQEQRGLKTALVDFAGGVIRFNPVYEETVRSVLKEIEPQARIRASSDADDSEKKLIFGFFPLKLFLSLVLFGSGLIVMSFKPGFSWLEWVLFLSSYALAGQPVIFGAVRNILKGRIIDELFLMTVATIGAFVIGELPEAAAVMLFYTIGETLQTRAVSRSRDAIQGAMALRVSIVRLVSDSEVNEVRPESVSIGSILEILPGDMLALDGMVIEGESWMDTSALTGESTLRRASPGDAVSAGFINDDGRIRVQTTKQYGDSAIARVKKLLVEASSRKSKTE